MDSKPQPVLSPLDTKFVKLTLKKKRLTNTELSIRSKKAFYPGVSNAHVGKSLAEGADILTSTFFKLATVSGISPNDWIPGDWTDTSVAELKQWLIDSEEQRELLQEELDTAKEDIKYFKQESKHLKAKIKRIEDGKD